MTYPYEMIVCIVNTGYSEAVMQAAREYGARGGTVIGARGTANAEAETFFKISIQPEKEAVLIVVPAKIKEDILHALYREVGLNTPGQGVAFTLPVDHVAGIFEESAEPDEGKAEKKEKAGKKE